MQQRVHIPIQVWICGFLSVQTGKPLWTGIRKHRGKSLAAFLKAIGFIIPLMDREYAEYYTKEVMTVLVREFQSPDEEMRKIVLLVLKQCAATDGVEKGYLKEEVMPAFYKAFWVNRMALDRKNFNLVVSLGCGNGMNWNLFYELS